MSNLSERLPESKIVEFLETDDECTVDLDLLVELGVYSRKHGAVQSLKKSFIEGVDFSQESVKRPSGGRPSDSYLLTSDCFKEMCLMADSEMGRMVRRYYITVEKRWKKQRKASIVMVQSDPAIAQLLAQSQQIMLQTQQMAMQIAAISQQQGIQLAMVSDKVAEIESAQQEAIASLDEIPEPAIEAEELTTRAKVRRLVNDYCAAKLVHQQEVWRRVYREFKDRYRIDLKQRAKNIEAATGKKVVTLDICEQLGKIEELYAVAFDLLKA
ncbi:MAG TPA: hypothetical protein V6C63_16845 [Allocoleopsis sp.]